MHPETEKKLRALLAAVESALCTARDVCEDELGTDDEGANRGVDYVRDALQALRSGREWLLPSPEELAALAGAHDLDESMDGDAGSALASAGFGTNEDYGVDYGIDDGNDDYGVDISDGEDW